MAAVSSKGGVRAEGTFVRERGGLLVRSREPLPVLQGASHSARRDLQLRPPLPVTPFEGMADFVRWEPRDRTTGPLIDLEKIPTEVLLRQSRSLLRVSRSLVQDPLAPYGTSRLQRRSPNARTDPERAVVNASKGRPRVRR